MAFANNKKITVKALFCALLALLFALTVILPYTHRCDRANCTLCSMTELSQKLVFLCAAIFWVSDVGKSVAFTRERKLSGDISNDLVTLKVKLSD